MKKHLTNKKEIVIAGTMILISILMVSAISWTTDGIVTLLVPTNNTTIFDFNTSYDFTGNASTQGAALTNLSFYHNFNGTWILNQTINISVLDHTENQTFNPTWTNSDIVALPRMVIGTNGTEVGSRLALEAVRIAISDVLGDFVESVNVTNFAETEVLGTADLVGVVTGAEAWATFSVPIQLEPNTFYVIQSYNNSDSTPIVNRFTSVVGGIAQTNNFTTFYAEIDASTVVEGFSGLQITAPNSSEFNWTFNSSIPFGTDFLWSVEGCATDNTCGFAVNGNFTLNRDLFLRNETFNTETISGNQEFFEVNISMLGRTLSSANLSYNNTDFPGAIARTGQNYSISTTIEAPVTNETTNKSFFWSLFFDDDSNVNTTSNNQTVTSIRVDACTSFTVLLANYTVFDEEFQTIIDNSSLEIAVNIFTRDRQTTIFQFGVNSTNSISICLETNITTEVYSLDTIVKYEKKNVYATEYHNIVNQSLNTTSFGQNISLFDLNLSDSTEFQLKFLGIDFLPVESALIFVERQYIPENTFKVVELPITDSTGKTILHLVRNDVVYNIRVVKDGVVLGNFPNIVAFCQDFSIGDCRIDLNAVASVPSFSYDAQTGILFSPPTYNNDTSTVSFSFISATGLPKSVFMNITRNDVFGNRSLCTTSLISSSGTLLCPIDSSIRNTVLTARITVGDILAVVASMIIDESDFGSLGYVAWFFITLIMIVMFGDSKNGILIGMMVSYIGAIALGINRGTIIGLGSAGIWLITITALGIWRLNRERQQ